MAYPVHLTLSAADIPVYVGMRLWVTESIAVRQWPTYDLMCEDAGVIQRETHVTVFGHGVSDNHRFISVQVLAPSGILVIYTVWSPHFYKLRINLPESPNLLHWMGRHTALLLGKDPGVSGPIWKHTSWQYYNAPDEIVTAHGWSLEGKDWHQLFSSRQDHETTKSSIRVPYLPTDSEQQATYALAKVYEYLRFELTTAG